MAEPLFIDRELSWLEFNQRVLDRALDENVPLMERLKFLAISASNLDEFYRVRIGTLVSAIERELTRVSPSGMTPMEQLQAARKRCETMFADQYRCFREQLEPALAEQGLHRLSPGNLTTVQARYLKQVFEKELFSVLTPTAIDLDVGFPHLPNELVHLCVRLKRESRYAIIPAAATLSRFLSIPCENGTGYALLEDVVKTHVNQFFASDEVEECVPFRLIRNAEVELQEFSPSGLASQMAEALQDRSANEGIRLDVDASASEETLEFLRTAHKLAAEQVQSLDGPLDLGAFMQLSGQAGFDKCRYEPWQPLLPPSVPSEDLIFDVLAERDLLLHHPYDSYEPVVRMIEEAAEDPEVLAIKQTLYRVSRNSRVVAALRRAVENGKHVTVLVELKARFDEARNLHQARELELAGAHVIWGVKGYKTHAKLCIVVKRNTQGIHRYVHFGTGNYNESTARLYTDVSFMTANEDLGADAVAFFNAISGLSHPHEYRRIEAAPRRLREALLELIHGETQRARAGQKARILAKVNALVDTKIVKALYEASQVGVQIQLNVRGICCLKPGIKGLSENIRVVSIVDRFLEHSRVMYFHHGGAGRMFISSADWMPRNLDLRQELMIPVDDPSGRKRLMEILEAAFADNVSSSMLQPNGEYIRLQPPKGEQPFRSQEELYLSARRALKSDQRRKRTVFEPHLPNS
ncbi:MAG: polyphosphate kinase 1 [Planctomycetaceae bacterium]|nr:polyphosphate kinase 1 [Planctomycetaceae bacterium]